MQHRFPIDIRHSNLIKSMNAGHFVCEIQGDDIQDGKFQVLKNGPDIPISEIQEIIETTHLTRESRLGLRHVRILCLLNPEFVDIDDLSPEDETDTPYFSGIIHINGWRMIKLLWSNLQ